MLQSYILKKTICGESKTISLLPRTFSYIFLHHKSIHKSIIMSNQNTTTMNKKIMLFIGFCVLGIFTWEAQAVNYLSAPIINSDVADPPQGFEKIDLHGDLLNNIGPNAVVAGANENSIYLYFNQSLGTVSISIYNEAGLVVYSTIVNTNVQQTFIIPFANAASGSYYVEISNAFGYADGDFNKD